MENTDIKLIIQQFLLSLLSRKFLLAIIGTYIAFNAGYADGVLTSAELMVALTPILGFLGIEGFGDVQERKADGQVRVQEAKTDTAQVNLQTAKVESKKK